jgi:hypothetical protein
MWSGRHALARGLAAENCNRSNLRFVMILIWPCIIARLSKYVADVQSRRKIATRASMKCEQILRIDSLEAQAHDIKVTDATRLSPV